MFVSPHGQAEWTELDFWAVMCGCLVIKPGAEHFQMYPNILEAGNMAVTVQEGWGDLQNVLYDTFQVRVE